MELSDATDKTQATPGIVPGTFRLVAQCLNHYATQGPRILVLFICITRLASKEILLASNKIQQEVGRAKELISTLEYVFIYKHY
jgi:hypothetical protein